MKRYLLLEKHPISSPLLGICEIKVPPVKKLITSHTQKKKERMYSLVDNVLEILTLKSMYCYPCY